MIARSGRDVLDVRSSTADVHPAIRAWATLRPDSFEPAVVPLTPQLKRSQKSAVYRLVGVGERGGNVVAKRCASTTARRESLVYERVLPHVNVRTLRFYGRVDEPEDDRSWLFIEDAGDDALRKDDYPNFATWLASLHASASKAAEETRLPEGGQARYLRHLRLGHGRVVCAMAVASFTPEERQVLRRTAAYCGILERHWGELESLTHQVPETLVHGDLSSKNLRVRRDSGTVQIFALDWETAGWGIPAADLGKLRQDGDHRDGQATDLYIRAIQPFWVCARSDIQLMAHIGLVFRTVAGIDWVSRGLTVVPGRKSVSYLRCYESYLTAALSYLGWRQ